MIISYKLHVNYQLLAPIATLILNLLLIVLQFISISNLTIYNPFVKIVKNSPLSTIIKDHSEIQCFWKIWKCIFRSYWSLRLSKNLGLLIFKFIFLKLDLNHLKISGYMILSIASFISSLPHLSLYVAEVRWGHVRVFLS